MALSERTRPYETLIRHNDDGSINAHHAGINEVLRDGKVIAATVMPPGPVSGEALAAVLTETTQAALLSNAALTAERETLRRESTRLAEENADLQKRLDAITAEMVDLGKTAALVSPLQAQVADLTTQLADSHKSADALKGRVAELEDASV